MHLKQLKYISFFLTVVILNGCGIFETRDPESPQNVRSTYFPPTTAEIVIENTEYAIQEKNSENYNKCISSFSYNYVPDSRSQQNYEIFDHWSKQNEKQYMDNLINNQEGGNSSAVLFLDNERMTLYSSDSARYTADYIFVFQHNRTNLPKSARGRLTMILATDPDELYYIRRWEDFRMNDTDFTWSEFKANFSN